MKATLSERRAWFRGEVNRSSKMARPLQLRYRWVGDDPLSLVRLAAAIGKRAQPKSVEDIVDSIRD